MKSRELEEGCSFVMASGTNKKEIERLEDDNRALTERLAVIENELNRRDESLKLTNSLKEQLSQQVKESQKKVKDLLHELEKAEDAEYQAKGKLE